MRYPVNYISITQGFHTGKCLDFGYFNHKYQDIMAVDNGVVLKVEYQNLGGNVIYIKHNNGMVSCYAHLDKIIVKKNDKVKLGQKIGTMGKTGQVSGMHLHFGLYINDKNIYGNSTVDPFNYLEVYKNQVVNNDSKIMQKYLGQIKYYEDKEVWTKGKYELIVSKAIRYDRKLGRKYIVEVGECKRSVRPYLTSSNPKAKAFYKVGTIVKITEIYKESNGRIWGKLENCYIVLVNKNGIKQANKVD